MIKSYLLTAYRSMLRNKGFSLINLVGLAIGLAAFMVITIWIRDELSFDKHLDGYNNIYRIVYRDANWSQPRTPHPLPLAMAKDFPEVENGVSLSPIFGSGLSRSEFTVRYLDKSFEEKEVLSVDSTFFDVFPFKMLLGNPKEALRNPGGIVLTRSTAIKYFGNTDPMGQILEFNGDTKLFVAGVVEDVPRNTHFTFDFLVSYVSLKAQSRNRNNGELSDYYTWSDFGHYNYIKLAPNVNHKTVEARIFEWLKNYIPFSAEQLEELKQTNARLELQPIADIHLRSNLPWELGANGNIIYVYAFSIVAFLMLGIAIFNYVNLSTARYEKRAKEVGVRKTLGAQRFHIIFQFLTESILMVAASLIIALIAVEMLLPSFNIISGKHIQNILSLGISLWIFLFVVAVIVGIVSGAYPAFFLSVFSPNDVLKGKLIVSGSNINLRKILVSFQFAISVFLIICTLGIYNQIEFLRKQRTGFSGENVVVVRLRSGRIRNNFESFKEKVSSVKGVFGASGVSNVPGGQFNNNSIKWKADGDEINSAELFVDEDFIPLMQIHIEEGRNFSKEFSADSLGSFILNRAACKQLGIENPIDEIITWFGDYPGTVKGKIVGVTHNFNFQSLHQSVRPLIIQRLYSNNQIGYLLVSVDPTNSAQVISEIKKIYEDFESIIPFKHSYLTTDLEGLYNAETRIGKLFLVFTLLTLFVASLGLLGLATFSAQQRTKEIGIRKVHGARTGEIYFMLTKSFGMLALVSNLVAWPLAYFLLSKWMNNFAFKASQGFEVYLIATLSTLIIASLSTGYQCFMVARQNPVNALKYE